MDEPPLNVVFGEAGDAVLEPPLEAYCLARRLAAEALGTALLLAIVIGSGIMGDRLAGGNAAIALLGNTLATGAGLTVLITVLGPISGAHFNPAVTLAFAVRGEIGWRRALAYMAVHVTAGVAGVWLAHAMFAEPVFQVSAKLRSGPAEGLAEFVATFGLIGAILGSLRFRPDATPWVVGLYITSAYWFTASTSFANPAVTLARSLSNTFAGIAPASVPLFLAAQIAGALAAVIAFGWLLGARRGPRATQDRTLSEDPKKSPAGATRRAA
jgi:glycerol uptake facilitator-like aquaporin